MVQLLEMLSVQDLNSTTSKQHTLEEDSKLYNSGIVDVSYRYQKMFVVRPQNFLAIIGLLRSMALNNLAYKQQVIAYQRENVDITNFEAAVRAVAERLIMTMKKQALCIAK